VSGVTRYITTLFKLFNKDKEFRFHLIINSGDALSLIQDLNYKVTVFPFKVGYKGAFTFLSALRFIEEYCSENKINIIHTHHRYPELIASYISKKNKIKTISTVHSIVSGFKTLSFRSDKIIAVSNYVASFLKEKYDVDDKKIIVLNNCLLNIIDDKCISNQAYLSNDSSKVRLLYAGRFSQDKGTDILVEVFNRLKNNYNLELYLVGMNYDYKISDSNSDSIKIISPVVNIEKIFSDADIFILPSRVDPFPYFMLEAGLFKKPFIGSKTGGIAEFIDDGVNGFLFEPGNPNDLAEKIRFVLNHPLESKSSAIKLNEKVNRVCNCESYFQKLSNIYHELLAD